MPTIEERVTDSVMKAVARICKKDISTLSRNTRFVDDLYIKSANVVELVSLLENEFQVEIPFGEARRNKTIGEAIDLVVRLRTM